MKNSKIQGELVENRIIIHNIENSRHLLAMDIMANHWESQNQKELILNPLSF